MYCEEENPGVTVLEDAMYVDNGITSYDVIFEKYKITHALIMNSSLISQYISDDENYELIYQDDIFSIYEKNQ
jgi:hypothetical protein